MATIPPQIFLFLMALTAEAVGSGILVSEGCREAWRPFREMEDPQENLLVVHCFGITRSGTLWGSGVAC